MRHALIFLAAPFLVAQTTPQAIQGKDLKTVPGPFVDRFCSAPGYHDPAEGPGTDDLQMQIREASRRSPAIPAVALPEGPVSVSDHVGSVAGWKAYRVEVAAGAKVHARIHAAHEAWFKVRTVNRVGAIEEGMLQNLLGTGNPEASYTNPKKEPNTIFIVVDTTNADAVSEPYELVVDWPEARKR